MMKNKLKEIKIKIFAMELLTILKERYSYNKLSKIFRLAPPILSRYIKGYVLPNLKRSEEIIELFKKKYLTQMIKSKIRLEEGEVLYIHPLICDTKLMKVIGKTIFYEFSDLKVDKILTMETGGIPLAVQVANEFGVDVIIARKEREVIDEDFVEGKYIVSPGVVKNIYIPAKLIKQNERILIVDDLIRSGKTCQTLIKLVEKMKAKVIGVCTIISVGKGINKLKRKKYRVLSFLIY